MAQSVERILGKDEVPSSILGISTIFTAHFTDSAKEISLETIALWHHLNPSRTQK